jgi:hypothetical protein
MCMVVCSVHVENKTSNWFRMKLVTGIVLLSMDPFEVSVACGADQG